MEIKVQCPQGHELTVAPEGVYRADETVMYDHSEGRFKNVPLSTPNRYIICPVDEKVIDL